MSYKYTVLQDKPTSFYMLDEIRSGSIGDYTNLMLRFATYQDLKDNGVSYSAVSGLPIYDYSGNANDGYAINASTKELMPIVPGTVRGTEVLSDTKIAFKVPGIATKYYSDNSFAIELWVKLPAESSSSKMILGDSVQGFGIFYQNSNILFNVGSYSCSYKVSNKEALHIVAQFSSTKISISVNGIEVDSVSLDNYKFTNEVMNFNIGPIGQTFFVDAAAFYRFNLSPSQVRKHYSEGTKEINYSQIVNADNGYLFSINASRIKPSLSYTYPGAKSWEDVADDGILVSQDKQYLYFEKTDTAATASFEFIDELFIPSHIGVTTSQIHWDEDVAGIRVYVSSDKIDWNECTNGSPMPLFNKNDNLISDTLYIKVVISSTDTSKDFTRLRSIRINFFKNKDVYADNFGYSLSSEYDYAIPEFNSKVLSYNEYNGIKMYDGHGFSVNASLPVKTIEMIYTPAAGENVLISTPSAAYEWSSSGAVTKSGISAIYVNGINRQTSTNTSYFLVNGAPHHVVVVLSSPASSGIKINQNQADTKSGQNQLYSNLSVYDYELLQHQISKHYKLYTDNIVNLVNDTSFSIVESTAGNNSTPFIVFSVQPDAISV
jgi:hypothetical protein